MVIRTSWFAAAAMILVMVSCGDFGQKADVSVDLVRKGEFVWQVPKGFPIPAVPEDNPMTWEKIELGRKLFHDPRLSGDGSVACATCHKPELAYTDGRARAKGIKGNIHPRSAMSLTNVAYNATIGWDDPTLTRLEDQIPIPLFNTLPPEMGAAGLENEILSRLKKDRGLVRLFQKAFPQDKEPVILRNVIYALASFERTLISGNSPYDRWAYGAEADALDKNQRAGAKLFFSKRLSCFRCHTGFNLSGPVAYEGSGRPEAMFHNTALYNLDGAGAYPVPNTGVNRHTGNISDMGKFRAPTLRNVALTAPYMHDGSIATLEEVLDHYEVGGRSRGHNADSLMTGFRLSPEEKKQLIAFLRALTDPDFIRRASAQAE